MINTIKAWIIQPDPHRKRTVTLQIWRVFKMISLFQAKNPYTFMVNKNKWNRNKSWPFRSFSSRYPKHTIFCLAWWLELVFSLVFFINQYINIVQSKKFEKEIWEICYNEPIKLCLIASKDHVMFVKIRIAS